MNLCSRDLTNVNLEGLLSRDKRNAFSSHSCIFSFIYTVPGNYNYTLTCLKPKSKKKKRENRMNFNAERCKFFFYFRKFKHHFCRLNYDLIILYYSLKKNDLTKERERERENEKESEREREFS